MWGSIISGLLPVVTSALGNKGKTNARADPFPELTELELARLMELFTNPRQSAEFLEFRRGMSEAIASTRSDLRGANERSGVSQRSGRYLRAEAHEDQKVLSGAAQMTSAYLTKLLSEAPGRAHQLRNVFMNAPRDAVDANFWDRLGASVPNGDWLSYIEGIQGLMPENPAAPTSPVSSSQQGAFARPPSSTLPRPVDASGRPLY